MVHRNIFNTKKGRNLGIKGEKDIRQIESSRMGYVIPTSLVIVLNISRSNTQMKRQILSE